MPERNPSVDITSLPWLVGQPAAAVAELAAVTRLRRYRPGAFLFAEGEPAEGVHFVVSGRVRVSRTTPDGGELVLHLSGPGELLALTAFLGGQPYPATAEPVGDAVVGMIPAGAFAAALHRHPSLAWAMLGKLADRLLWAQQRIAMLSRRDARARVAAAVLGLAHDGPVTIRHHDLAALAGVTRETTTRVLHRLAAEGAVRLQRGGLVVSDATRLAAAAGWLS